MESLDAFLPPPPDPTIQTTVFMASTQEQRNNIIKHLLNLILLGDLPKSFRLLTVFYNSAYVVSSSETIRYTLNSNAYTMLNIDHFIQNVKIDNTTIPFEITENISILPNINLSTDALSILKSTSPEFINYDIYLIGIVKSDLDIMFGTPSLSDEDKWRYYFGPNSNTVKKLNHPHAFSLKTKTDNLRLFHSTYFILFINILEQCIHIFYNPGYNFTEENKESLHELILDMYNDKNNTDSIYVVAGAALLLIIDVFDISLYTKNTAKQYVLNMLRDSNIPIFNINTTVTQVNSFHSSYWLGSNWSLFTDKITDIIPPPSSSESIISTTPSLIYPDRIDNILFKITDVSDISLVIDKCTQNDTWRRLLLIPIIYTGPTNVIPADRSINYSRTTNSNKIKNIDHFIRNVSVIPYESIGKPLISLLSRSSYLQSFVELLMGNASTHDVYIMGIYDLDEGYMFSRKYSINSWVWYFQASHTHYLGDGPPPIYMIDAISVDTSNKAFQSRIETQSHSLRLLSDAQYHRAHPRYSEVTPAILPSYDIVDKSKINRHKTDKASVIILTGIHGSVLSQQPLIDGIHGHLYRLDSGDTHTDLEITLSEVLAEMMSGENPDGDSIPKTIDEIANEIYINFMYWSWQLCNVHWFPIETTANMLREFRIAQRELDSYTKNGKYLSHFIDTKLDQFRTSTRDIVKNTPDMYLYKEEIKKGFSNTVNNNYMANQGIPYYDVLYSSETTPSSKMIIALLGNVPSKNPPFNTSAKINQRCAFVMSDITNRLIPDPLRPIEVSITLSYILVSLYLSMNGKVVSYIIDPSCKGVGDNVETVMSRIPTESNPLDRHSIIELVHTHKGQHLVETSTITDRPNRVAYVNPLQQHSQFINRQQKLGYGLHKSNRRRMRNKLNTKKIKRRIKQGMGKNIKSYTRNRRSSRNKKSNKHK
jgi:hypothetical protein